MVVINKFKGIVTRRRALMPGEMRDCVNMLPDQGRLKLRYGDTAIYTYLSIGNGVLGMFQHRKDDGTLRIYVATDNDLIDQTNTTIAGVSFTAQFRPDFCNGFDKMFITEQTSNYVLFDQTDARLLVEAAPSGTISGSETGASAATDFGTGTFEYTFTNYDPTTGWEGLPKGTSASVVKVNANTGVKFTTAPAGSFVSPYTKIRLYRRLRTTNQWYLIATLGSGDFPYQDVTLEGDFLSENLSNVHDNETGLIDMEDPGSQGLCAFYRGRLFLAHGDTVRWSRVGLPFSFKSSGIAQKEIGDEGDPIQKLVVWGESLVVFKQFSIWVLNGDIDEQGFTFYPATRNFGAMHKGLVCSTPHGIFFLDSSGRFRLFNLSDESLTWYNDDLEMEHSVDQAAAQWNIFSGYDPVEDTVFLYADDGYFVTTPNWIDELDNAYFTAGIGGHGWMYCFKSDGFIRPSFQQPNGVELPYGCTEVIYDSKKYLAYVGIGGGKIHLMGGRGEQAVTLSTLSGSHTTTQLTIPLPSDYTPGQIVIFYDVSTGLFYRRGVLSVGLTSITLDSALPVTPVNGDIVGYFPTGGVVLGPYSEGNPLQKRLDRVHFVIRPTGAKVRFLAMPDDTQVDSATITAFPTLTGAIKRFVLRVGQRAVAHTVAIAVWGIDHFELQEVHYEAKSVRGSNLI